MIPLLEREFPDFDQTTLPAIPDGFECTAWHNEPFPTWHDGHSTNATQRGMLMLGVDFAEPNMREFPDTKRFVLQIYSGDDAPQPVVDSDDWSVIEAWVRIARHIRDDMGLGFHPDTRGRDYVDLGGRRAMSAEEAARYDADIELASGVGDVYETSMRIWQALGLLERNQ